MAGFPLIGVAAKGGVTGILQGGGIQAPIMSTGGGLLAQILQGVQAGSLVISSYYQGQGMINSSKAEAEAAKYPATTYYGAPVTAGAGVTASDPSTMLMFGAGALLLVMMMNKKK